MNLHDYEHERGHSLKPDPAVLAMIPPLYATEGIPKEEKQVFVHYFVGNCNWYLMELDQEEWLAFGWCDLGQGYPELGYFSVHELGSIQATGRLRFVDQDGSVTHEGTMPIYVERDLHWPVQPFGFIDA